jgi:nitrilase
MSAFVMAAVQAAPVFLDAAASAEKACGLIDDAATQGADLVAFSETWLPGYPRWINAPVAVGLKRELGGRYLAASVSIPGPEIDIVCATARRCGVDVVMGVAEVDPVSHGTTYCTLVFIGADGEILGTHRKLKPTYGERFAWGEGDGSGLRVHARPYARISGLNCWEHNMVLPGYALMAQGTQVHVAAFPGYESASGGTRQTLLSRAFASQAAAYVMLVGGLLSADDVADPVLREVIATLPPLTGDSCIIDPTGEVIAGPCTGEEILFAKGSLELLHSAKALCDVGGHYSRPDVLRLTVNRTPARRIIEVVDED